MLNIQLVAPPRHMFTCQSSYDLYCYDTSHSRPSVAIPVSLQCTGVFVSILQPRQPLACPLFTRCRVFAKLPKNSPPSILPAADIRDPWRLYTVLGLSSNVEVGEIKSAYRQLARQYHPDVCQTVGVLTQEECTRRFIEVQEAYETLTDPRKRFLYDFERRSSNCVGEKGGLGRRRLWQEEKRPWARKCEWSSFEEQVRERAAVWALQALALWEGGRRLMIRFLMTVSLVGNASTPLSMYCDVGASCWSVQEEMMRNWRSHVSSQLDGLKARKRNKPGSWAAAMTREPNAD